MLIALVYLAPRPASFYACSIPSFGEIKLHKLAAVEKYFIMHYFAFADTVIGEFLSRDLVAKISTLL